jgi:hypothetical protein
MHAEVLNRPEKHREGIQEIVVVVQRFETTSWLILGIFGLGKSNAAANRSNWRGSLADAGQ